MRVSERMIRMPISALGDQVDPVRPEGAAQANHAVALMGGPGALARQSAGIDVERRQCGEGYIERRKAPCIRSMSVLRPHERSIV